MIEKHSVLDGIAIIGTAGRFPGAASVAEFWRNQCSGIESISRFTLDPTRATEELDGQDFVAARSVLRDVDLFDADFFGITPKDAELMDPQHRVFLECCWEAIEDAGYDPKACPELTGVYAGCSPSTYFLHHVCADHRILDAFTAGYQVSNYPVLLGNNVDFLATRVSYKLNLRGPAYTLQAGCSTSLLAVCQAARALQAFECDMALAGGVSITFPQERGHIYLEGGMVSPDGHIRAFDRAARGTVFGSGAGVVVLKRLEDAVSDRDRIIAIIRGFAVNNDGAGKVGYTAPSVEGQARVIAMAHDAAGVSPDTIGYIEAHGTGTPLGDPIEVAALTKAFRRGLRAENTPRQFCVLGTAKANVGHLDIAAGVTGLIHATHVVSEGIFPPTLHFRDANPDLHLDESPFLIRKTLSRWLSGSVPRRAGVSAFGIGGTNTHVVLEQAEALFASEVCRPVQVLTISARSETALAKATTNLAAHLNAHPETPLADAAWTLQAGRHGFEYRRSAAVTSVQDAIRQFSIPCSRTNSRRILPENRGVAFLFPGQGSQYPNMAREIYQSEPVYRQAVDRCCAILTSLLGIDLKDVLYPAENASGSQTRIRETMFAQPAIFTVSYALAQLWASWGIHPATMLGHSVGEFAAACVAQVFSLEDALQMIVMRARMMQNLHPGAMLTVALSESELRSRINGSCSIAAVNSSSVCVVAGLADQITHLERALNAEGITCRQLATSHAFHSSMMDPIVEPFAEVVSRMPLHEPLIPYVSCVTGTWITPGEATDPAYWARHMRHTVQFSTGVQKLMENPNLILLEVGPGKALSGLAKRNVGLSSEQVIVSSLPSANEERGDASQLMQALGTLWEAGVQVDWKAVHSGESRQRLSLPTYPFERRRHWIDRAPDPQLADSEIEPCSTPKLQNSPIREIKIDMQTSVTESASASHIIQLIGDLARIFEDLSGINVAEFGGRVTFVEMGFDSLFLTQVTQAVQKKFAVKITFRQLLSDLSTLDALAEYLSSRITPPKMKADTARSDTGQCVEPVLTEEPTAAVSCEPNSATGASQEVNTMPESAIDVERLMREQMRTMNQLFASQLEVIRRVPGVSASSPSTLQSQKIEPPEPALETKATSRPVGPASDSAATASPTVLSLTPNRVPHGVSAAALNERQRQGIKVLTEHYTRKTPGSKRQAERYRRYLADPRVVAGFRAEWKELVYPICTVRSKGSRLWDVDGNEYIDLLNGFGPILLGHRPEFIAKAIERQLHEGFEIGPQTPLAGDIAEMFCEMTGNERMTFCNTGSEAVIAALRVVRTVTAREKVVVFSGSYHGMFDEVLVKGFRNRNGDPQVMPATTGIPASKVANLVVLDYGTRESLDWIRQHASEIAAVLVEPVQSRHPNLQPVEFLRELRDITAQSETGLIFDEVVTGFRAHPGGCQALFGIRADLATYGKVLAGGLPIGVLAGKARFMDSLDGGHWEYGDGSYPETGVTFFAGTFVRHPLALSAAKAVLQHLKEQGPQLQQGLTEKTRTLVTSINGIFSEHGLATRIETFASLFYLAFSGEERYGSLLYYFLRAKGIHLLEGFPCFLTTAHTDDDLERVVNAFRESVQEMVRWEFFKRNSVPAENDFVEVTHIARSAVAEAAAEPTSHEAPTTEPQLEIWLSDQLGNEASCSYNESFSLHLRGNLSEPDLKVAVREAVSRHDSLRATFHQGGSIQRFVSESLTDIPTIDLTTLTVDERGRRVLNAISDDARLPFRLAEGPLVRAQLLRLEPQYSIMIFTAHHIVCDGWSANVLLDEISKIYNGIQSGIQHNLPEPVSFAAYAEAQKSFVDSAEGQRIEKYWLKRFERPVARLDLPLDGPRPAVREFPGETYRCRISGSLYDNIRKASTRQKCTLFVTMLAGFQILLSRLSGLEDIVVNVPMAGQAALDNSSLVGHCVNFLPLRAVINSDATVSQVLAQTKQTVLEAYENQNYTYGRLVRKLSLERDPSRLPLTEVQFNLERVGEDLEFAKLQVEVDPNPKSFVNFDIFLNVVEGTDGLVLDCDYNTGLFRRETIERWLEHYETLLGSLAANDDQPVADLQILGGTHVQEWNSLNATEVEYPQVCVHQLVEAQVRKTPHSTAVVFGDRQVTYEELDRRAEQVANHLRRSGVGRGQLVGVLMERSVDMVAALLGILKSGAGYVPMDPTYPDERIAFVLSDANLPILLTHRGLNHNVASASTRVVDVDRIPEETDAPELQQHPSAGLTPDNLAYVIYTSGSTGRPKGVEITHRAVVNLLNSMSRKPGLTANDTLTAVTTLSFDIAALELFLPLYAGAKLVVASREVAADGPRLLALLRSSGTTIMQATPVTWKLLLDAGWDGSPRLKVLCGGEAITRDLANALAKRAASVWNMYGPTETTIWSSANLVTEGEGPVLIGPPIDNTQFYVLDNHGHVVPPGVSGELHIGGEGLARGYFRRSELTSEKFILAGKTEGLPGRLYKTGDLVKRNVDGTIEFLGRLDHQVKLRGYRIELGEIEAVIARYPGVKEVIVIIREDIPGDKRLVAYLTSDQQAISINVIREFLTGKLPNYMHPSAVVRMDSLPLTPNGKVDRSATSLPAPDIGKSPREREFVSPQTEPEKRMAAIWAEVLHLDRVGINDNLFELGADSLHIFQIAARAAQAGISIAPAQFWKYRTIASLLALLEAPDAAVAGQKTAAMRPIVSVGRDKYRLKRIS